MIYKLCVFRPRFFLLDISRRHRFIYYFKINQHYITGINNWIYITQYVSDRPRSTLTKLTRAEVWELTHRSKLTCLCGPRIRKKKKKAWKPWDICGNGFIIFEFFFYCYSTVKNDRADLKLDTFKGFYFAKQKYTKI